MEAHDDQTKDSLLHGEMPPAKRKFLLIRFSSIGDIVLTTPVIRCLKTQLPDAEVHFLVRDRFLPVIQHNPYIDKIHVLAHSWELMIEELRTENFDYIIDLHPGKQIDLKRSE